MTDDHLTLDDILKARDALLELAVDPQDVIIERMTTLKPITDAELEEAERIAVEGLAGDEIAGSTLSEDDYVRHARSQVAAFRAHFDPPFVKRLIAEIRWLRENGVR